MNYLYLICIALYLICRVDCGPLGSSSNCPSNRLQKIAFMQQGYFQLVEFMTPSPVPLLDDFTLCYWVKSVNLTYRQTTFSYAAAGDPQAISTWIEPSIFGTTINMVIGGQEVYSVPYPILQHRWYHICHSWEGISSQWLLYVNGDVAGQGIAENIPKRPIPGAGFPLAGQQQNRFDASFDRDPAYDRTYGVEGEMTLFFFDSRPLRTSIANLGTGPNINGELLGTKQVHDISYVTAGVQRFGKTCLEQIPGNIIAWGLTDMKLFGGARITLAKPSCGDF